MAQLKVQKAIYSLLQVEPFFANFILNCKVMYDTDKVPTAGVCVRNGVPNMIFNSEFIEKLTQPEVQGVIKHEIMHLLYDHLTTTKDEKKNAFLSNLAQDCAINQYIPELYKEPYVTVEGFEKQVGKKLEKFQTSDYYYSKIKDHVNKMIASGMVTVDEHGTMDGQDLDAIAQGAVKRVGEAARRQSAGNVPEHLGNLLDAFGDSKLSWASMLRNMIMTQVSRKTQGTNKKINRRFRLPVPGKKRKRELTLGVCFDESGSVSNEQLQLCFNEVKTISKLITKTYLVHADCEVASVEDLSKVKLAPVRKAGGGTAYQPAIDKCMEMKCDMIIYFGDFDCADIPKDPGKPFIWIGVGTDQKPPASFGRVIRI